VLDGVDSTGGGGVVLQPASIATAATVTQESFMIVRMRMSIASATGQDVGSPLHHGAMLTVAELLDFEAEHPRHTGAKEVAIRVELGVTPARFYQLLDRAASSLEGQWHDPMTARRLRDGRRRVA